MNFEINTIKSLQKLFKPLYSFFEVITQFGSEIFIFFVVTVVYFGFSKKFGEKLGFLLLFSSFFCCILKILIHRPRPFVNDPSVATSKYRLEEGFSMPSGHSQSAAALYFSLIRQFKKRWLTAICLILMVLVPISRAVLGVHYPSDLAVGIILGLSLVYFVDFLFEKLGEKIYKLYFWLAMAIFLAVFLILPFSIVDSGFCKSAGALCGFCLIVCWENKHVGFEIAKTLSKKIFSIAVSLLIILALRLLFQAVFTNFSDNNIFDFIKYFVMIFVGLLLSIKIFQKYL